MSVASVHEARAIKQAADAVYAEWSHVAQSIMERQDISQVIKQARLSKRNKASWSREYLSSMSGVSYPTIAKVENGHHPSVKTAVRLLKALSIPLRLGGTYECFKCRFEIVGSAERVAAFDHKRHCRPTAGVTPGDTCDGWLVRQQGFRYNTRNCPNSRNHDKLYYKDCPSCGKAAKKYDWGKGVWR